MIVAPGSPEDVLQCPARPGSQVCPMFSTLALKLDLAKHERTRHLADKPFDELLAMAYARYSTHRSPRPEEWDDIDETHARVSKAARER